MSEIKSNPLKRFLLWLSGAPDGPIQPPASASPLVDPVVDPAATPAESPEAHEVLEATGVEPVPAAPPAEAEQSTSHQEIAAATGEEAETSAAPTTAAVAAVAVAAEVDSTDAGDHASAAPAEILEAENDATGYGVTIEPADVPPGRPYWRAIRVHHLTPDENHGNHHIYLDALDDQGARVNGARGRVTWDGGEQIVTIDKPVGEPGTNFPMWKWQVCSVDMMNLQSDCVAGLHTGHPDEPPGAGNTLFHHSFAVTFQRAVKDDQPASESAISGTVTGAAGRTLLLTLEGEIVARQVLGVTAAYRFDRLPAGNYVLAVEGSPMRSDVISLDGQSQANVNLSMPAVTIDASSLVIDRYFLFGAPNSARTAVYLDLARSYLLSRQPTFGFRVADAAHARQVVLMGAVEDISQEAEDTLRQAGCQVMRIQGTPQQIQDALRQMDAGGHQVFLPATPVGR